MSAHSYSAQARARTQIGVALGLFLAPLQQTQAENVTLLARLRADLPGTNAALDSGVALQRRFATEPLLSTTLLRPTSLRSATGLEKLPESPWLNKSPHTPDAQLRRWISVEYPSTGPLQTTALIAGLKATGLFDLVENPVKYELAAVESEPLYSYAPSDPQRHQWAADRIGLDAALTLTLGRAPILVFDGGLVPTHPDLAPNLRTHLSWYWYDDPAPFAPTILDPVLDPGTDFAGHGTHVAGIMAAAKNNLGMIGTCPGCSLLAFRVDFSEQRGLAAPYPLLRTGATAVNMSFNSESFIVGSLFNDSINTATNRGVFLAAATGNGRSAAGGGSGYPASDPNVIGVAGSDFRNLRWDESIIKSLSSNLQHPRLIPEIVTARCEDYANPNAPRPNCGSNAANADISAPAAQILSTISDLYITFPTCTTLDSVCNMKHVPSCQPDVSNIGPGNLDGNLQGQWGTCSGTSMSAPFVTGTAGLIRSVNPLLSWQQVRDAMILTAQTMYTPDPNNNFLPTTTPYPAGEVGAGLLKTDLAVKRALGKVRGAQLNNRLTPMLALVYSGSQFPTIQGTKSWLYTTNAQAATGALVGDLYQFSTTAALNIPYAPSQSVGIGVPAGNFSYPSETIKATTPASSSFYVFATEQNPAGRTLVPLYRLSNRCPLRPKFTYASAPGSAPGNLAWFTSRSVNCPTSGADAFINHAYNFDGVEGYVFSPSQSQPEHTQPLYRRYHPTEKSWALIMGSELGMAAYSGFTECVSGSSCQDLLGYVYPSSSYPGGTATLVDADGDGLIDGFELAAGLNELTANSDCDAQTDSTELPLTQLQEPSNPVQGVDPMTPTNNCADPRLTVSHHAPSQTTTVSVRNVGPSNIGAVTVDIDVYQPSGIVSPLPSGCTAHPTKPPIFSAQFLRCVSPVNVAAGTTLTWVLSGYINTNPSFTTLNAELILSGETDPVPGNNSVVL